jgi:hypothetical protein
VASPLRLTTSNFIFQLNTCDYSPYVTFSLTRVWVGYNSCWSSPAQSFSHPSPAGFMTTFYYLRFETPLDLEGQVPVFITPRKGWPGCTPRHWVPFSSSPTTRRATMEVFDPASTRDEYLKTNAGSCLHIGYDPFLPNPYILNGNIIILYFIILLHSSHSFTSVCNANTFYFKMSFTVTFKINKISVISHFLFICCNMFQPHEAIIRQPLIDRNYCTAWAHTSMHLHAIIACRRVRECTAALSSCYFRVAMFTLCSFVRNFLRSGVSPLYY